MKKGNSNEGNTGSAYAKAGVNYDDVDPYKLMAQECAKQTSEVVGNPLMLFVEDGTSRGESAFLMGYKGRYFATVIEGLGSKNLVADKMEELTGKCFYGPIAQDTIAMIVNDMITVNALPVVITQHIDMGNDDFFKKFPKKAKKLALGWRDACIDSGAVWGPGETAVLKGIIIPDTISLSGSAFGFLDPKNKIEESKICAGDVIVCVESSGIHANGLSLARKIAEGLPKGYLTNVYGGKFFGELLLKPTHIYVPFMKECMKRNVDPHYAVNVTGHGLRKFMRPNIPFQYVLDNVLQNVHPEFKFIQEHGNVSDEDMLGTFNMGVGFALYVSPNDAGEVIAAAKQCGLNAWIGGHVREARDNKKEVIVMERSVTFSEESMTIRA